VADYFLIKPGNAAMFPAFTPWLTKITMYRLMLYYLTFLVSVAIILSLIGILPYNALALTHTTLYLVAVCFVANQSIARLWRIKPNVESQYITALILTLIVGPVAFMTNVVFLTILGTVAMASKYILAWQKRHFFNPTAFAAVFAVLVLGKGASWWVGTPVMLPFIVLGGILIMEKTRRWHLALSFLIPYLVLTLFLTVTQLNQILPVTVNLLTLTPVVFFTFVMLVEPLTSPPDRMTRIFFGMLIAVVLVGLQQFAPSLSYTLELSLLVGNLFSRAIRFNPSVTLSLKKKEEIAPSVWTFWFEPASKVKFLPGQFFEWSLPHPHPDNRGTRRFFTIASSPTEPLILLTTKFDSKGSSFKRALKNLEVAAEIITSPPSGEFTLPKDPKTKCVFIAGGIGVTPFRSMVKYMLDEHIGRTITLFYSNRKAEDIVFKDLFDEAEKAFGLQTVYTLTEDKPAPAGGWQGKTGYIDADMIKDSVEDWGDRVYYVSGPEPMVQAFEKMLASMGITKKNIKHDYFPGYSESR
jgi:ferredoxin-NADP reductase